MCIANQCWAGGLRLKRPSSYRINSWGRGDISPFSFPHSHPGPERMGLHKATGSLWPSGSSGPPLGAWIQMSRTKQPMVSADSANPAPSIRGPPHKQHRLGPQDLGPASVRLRPSTETPLPSFLPHRILSTNFLFPKWPNNPYQRYYPK